MANGSFKVKKSLNVDPQAGSVVSQKGDIAYNSASDKLEAYNGAADPIVQEATAATLTNKSIDASTNTLSNIANAAISNAAAISFSKLEPLTSGHILVGSNINVVSDVAMNGDATIDNTGALTVDSVGGFLAADIATAITAVNSADFNNTPGTLVIRDGSGDFAAGTITADLVGNASNVTGVVAPDHGGTGIANNTASTLTISGNFATTVTVTGATGVTLPTTGTLATLAGAETLTNKVLSGNTASNLINGAGTINVNSSGTITIPNATDTLVAKATSDILTNKDLDGGTASNSHRITLPKASSATLAGLTRKQGTIIYDTDKNKPVYDDGVNLLEIGSGSGGGVNFIGMDVNGQLTSPQDRDAESVGTWGAYAVTAGTAPINDISAGSGSPTVTFSRSNTFGEVLDGTYSFQMDKDAANRQGEGVSVKFWVPSGYAGSECTVSFPWRVLSGSLAQGDLKFFLTYPTQTLPLTIISPNGNNIIGSGGVFKASFLMPNDVSGNNFIINAGFYFSSTATTAVTIAFDDVSVSPTNSSLGTGLAGTDWASYVPTFTGLGSGSAPLAYWRRVGDNLEVKGSYTIGTTDASLASISLPSGLAIDPNKLSLFNTSSGRGNIVGLWAHVSFANEFGNLVSAPDGSASQIFFGTSTVGLGMLTPQAGNAIMSSTDQIAFHFSVPIVGWESTSIETGVTARYYNSSTSISGSLATVDWTSSDYDSYSGMASGLFTVPVDGKYAVNSALLISGTFALNDTVIIEIQKSGSVVSRSTEYVPAALSNVRAKINDIVSCVAGDTIRIQVSSSATSPAIVSSNFDNYISLAKVGN